MRKLSLLLFASAICAPASAQTLQEAVGSAYRSNPAIQEARLALDAAREDIRQARADYLPQVDAVAEFGTSNRVEDRPVAPLHTDQDLDPATTSIRAAEQVYAGGRRSAQSRLARATVASAEQNLRSVEQDIVFDAVTAYAGLLRETQIVRIRRDNATRLTEYLRVTQRRLDVGDVSRTDLSQAQARLARAQAGEVSALAELEQTRASFEAITGITPAGLSPLPPPPALPETLDQALANAEAAHPALLQAARDVEAARARIGIERAALLPEVSVIARVDQAEDQNLAGDQIENAGVSARFAMRLYDGGMARSRVRQSRLGVEQAEQREEAVRREIAANVVTAWHDAAATRRLVEAARVQLEADEAAMLGVSREQGLGLRSTLDVLNAQQELLDSQLALARAEHDAFVSAYALLASVGALGPTVVDTGVAP
jgi:outer membrane protein